MQNNKGKWKYFPLFVLPTLIAFCIAFIVPFLMGIYLSFTKFTTVTNAKFTGLANYNYIFTSDNGFLHSLGFTALFTVVAVLSVNIFAFCMALLLTRGMRGTNLFRSVFFLPNLIGGIVLGYIWQIIINGVLLRYGVDITVSAKYGFWGLVVLMNWQLIGYMMVIYIAGLQNVAPAINEAAQIDGAGWFKRLIHITIPSVMPSFTICLFLTLTNSFKLFDQNLALTAGAPARQTEMLALNIYNTFYGRNGFEGVGQAKALLFTLMVMIIAFVQLKLTRSREVDE